MRRTAIIGTGIAGLSAGYFLNESDAVSVYEKNGYIGGHTNTAFVSEGDNRFGIDTGFMVFNDHTYPNLIKLFQRLQVPVTNTDMSLSVANRDSAFEFSGKSLSAVLLNGKHMFSPAYYRFLLDILRFNRSANECLNQSSISPQLTLKEFLHRQKFSEFFSNFYIYPMAGAIWSSTTEQISDFPALSLFRFFSNHGLLGVTTHHQWKTVVGGSETYKQKLIKGFASQIYTNRGAVAIEERSDGVQVTDTEGISETYDRVIIAAHADQALKMLHQPSDLQQRILGKWQYSSNTVYLCNDAAYMPLNRRLWSSWNFLYGSNPQKDACSAVSYWMNRLQHLSGSKDYFVVLDYSSRLPVKNTLFNTVYEHPLYNADNQRGENSPSQLNQEKPDQRIFFTGSYMGYGFHEDALRGSVALCRQLTGRDDIL